MDEILAEYPFPAWSAFFLAADIFCIPEETQIV